MEPFCSIFLPDNGGIFRFFEIIYKNNDCCEFASIGPNDMKLAQTLIKAGAVHRKFMRQIFVSVDITAPLYW